LPRHAFKQNSIAINGGKPRGTKPSHGDGPSEHSEAETARFKELVDKGHEYEKNIRDGHKENTKKADEVYKKLEKGDGRHKLEWNPVPIGLHSFKKEFVSKGFSAGNTYYEVTVKSATNRPLPQYNNLVGTKNGDMVSREAYKDMLGKAFGEEILEYSEFSFHTWDHRAEIDHVSPKNLQRIAVDNVDNPDTQRATNIALSLVSSHPSEYTFSRQSHPDGFYALSATSNLGFISKMLTQHPDKLGKRSIATITAYKHQEHEGVNYALLVHLNPPVD
jgi:hypothetical protein